MMKFRGLSKSSLIIRLLSDLYYIDVHNFIEDFDKSLIIFIYKHMMKFRGLSKSSLIYLPILQLISFKAVLISG